MFTYVHLYLYTYSIYLYTLYTYIYLYILYCEDANIYIISSSSWLQVLWKGSAKGLGAWDEGGSARSSWCPYARQERCCLGAQVEAEASDRCAVGPVRAGLRAAAELRWCRW